MDENEIKCICSRCKSNFLWNETIIVKRKLYNVEIEEHTCPKCGCKGITPRKEINYLSTMATMHTYRGH